MKAFLLTACLVFCVATFATGEVSITKSPAGWELTNGHIRVELARSSGAVKVKSLRYVFSIVILAYFLISLIKFQVYALVERKNKLHIQ